MFTIGEFSKITGLSIKAIRLYHEKGLLIPGTVDPITGYRYFDHCNIEKARTIAFLKGIAFSLSEIGELLEEYGDDMEVVEFLSKKRARIEQQITHLKSVSSALDRMINQEREAIAMLKRVEFRIEEKQIDDQLVACFRWRGAYSETGRAFGQLARALGGLAAGKPFNLYYDAEYKETDADIESCIPVKKTKKADSVTFRELRGGRCVRLIHKGPYEQIGRPYESVFEYMHAHDLPTSLPLREIYLKGPGLIFKGNPKNYLTEIQVMVGE